VGSTSTEDLARRADELLKKAEAGSDFVRQRWDEVERDARDRAARRDLIAARAAVGQGILRRVVALAFSLVALAGVILIFEPDDHAVVVGAGVATIVISVLGVLVSWLYARAAEARLAEVGRRAAEEHLKSLRATPASGTEEPGPPAGHAPAPS
jgi:hypothetical protein